MEVVLKDAIISIFRGMLLNNMLFVKQKLHFAGVL